MKPVKVFAAVSTILPCAAGADSYATIINVTPNYTYSESYENRKSCYTEDQPIYGNQIHGGASGSEILTGMILGGLAGKGATGKEQGAAMGAIIGGIVAADTRRSKPSVIGFKPVTTCEMIKVPQTTKTIKNYKIDYQWNGVVGSSYTYNHYRIGQLIPISVNIVAK